MTNPATASDRRQAALNQLETALRADAPDAKDFHVREALQLLHVESDSVPASDGDASATSDDANEAAN